MSMFFHVGTKPGGAPVENYQANQPALDECVKAIVDGGHGNVGHIRLGPDEHFLGSGMIALLEQKVIDMPPLGCEPEPATGEFFAQLTIGFGCGWSRRAHWKGEDNTGRGRGQYLE
jgi:hypothetical protein